jgi:large subunit ribosomal protein L29
MARAEQGADKAKVADLSDADLVHRVLQIERDLVAARFKHSLSQLENTSRLRVLRREIARLRTEARTREIESGRARDTLLAEHRRSFTGGQPAAAVEAPAEKGGFLAGIVDKLKCKE